MGSVEACVQRIIVELESGGNGPDVAERLLESALLFEKFFENGDWQRLSEVVDSASPTCEDVDALRTALINFAIATPEHPCVGTAIWALAKINDESLKDFFLNEMRRHHAAGRHFPVSQADYGLQRLGIEVGYEFAIGENDMGKYMEAVHVFLGKQPIKPTPSE